MFDRAKILVTIRKVQVRVEVSERPSSFAAPALAFLFSFDRPVAYAKMEAQLEARTANRREARFPKAGMLSKEDWKVKWDVG